MPERKLYNAWTVLIILFITILFLIIWLKPAWVIGGDGFAYYAYIRSILFDGDLNFHNEFSFFDDSFKTNTIKYWQTPSAKAGNPFSVGPSLFWSPFIFLAKILQNIFTFRDPYPLAGYNAPFQISIAIATIFYTSIALILLFSALKKLFKKNISWWSTILIVGISPLIYYLIYEPSMSHGLSLFSSSLLFYLSILLFQSKIISNRLLIYLGISIGLIFIIRWQDIIFAIVPAAIILQKYLKINNFATAAKQFYKHILLILIPFIIIASLQLFA